MGHPILHRRRMAMPDSTPLIAIPIGNREHNPHLALSSALHHHHSSALLPPKLHLRRRSVLGALQLRPPHSTET
ncbi:hypothetical protein CDL15_Pgr017457 [Punica granatum]|uniref:Uncharacterized protein n=1 Tax=Punica granatum TaxID=22663 RepID=A0A218W645_PUNGR|nr:hypothetical protein CDL15_Pgr017457 [Punica granatum]